MYRLSLATFVFIVGCLSMAFVSVPAFAGGAGGSWGCPDGWTTNADGSCSFGGGGGSTGGSGAGGSWSPDICTYSTTLSGDPYPDRVSACKAAFGNRYISVSGDVCNGTTQYGFPDSIAITSKCSPNPEPQPPEPPVPPPPPFPDLPPPPEDCNPCQQLYQIQLKLNVLKNQDIKYINQTIYDMSQVINNIDNSINDLSVNQTITNNHLTNIDNSIGDIITNIENNTITNNEIKNEITNIYETMNDYSLQLGDIKLAMGDIDVSLKNTNRLVLDLGLDIDWIKNKLVNDDSKDYTPYLNEIIGLLAPCVPTPEAPCPVVDTYDDTELIALLTEMRDFMQADFEPGIDDNTVSVTDLTDIELDRNLIKFGVAQCPPDNEFSTMVNGFSFSGGFKHKPLCDFFTLLAPFIKAFGGFSAALILGGGLRR